MSKFLIVDDSKAVHAFIKEALDGSGRTFTDAFDGKQALACLADQKDIGLVLLDWEMPVMTGIETIAAIRASGYDVPVIMVTSLNDMSNVTRALDAGADDYVMKPFTKDILLDKIEDVLARRAA